MKCKYKIRHFGNVAARLEYHDFITVQFEMKSRSLEIRVVIRVMSMNIKRRLCALQNILTFR